MKEYLDSLPRYRELPEDTLVLASHRDPFVGLHRRLDEFIEHHRRRLDLLLESCAEPKTVWQTLPYLFKRELDAFGTILAAGESLAHLNYLLVEGRLVRACGADGVHRYRRAAAGGGERAEEPRTII